MWPSKSGRSLKWGQARRASVDFYGKLLAAVGDLDPYWLLSKRSCSSSRWSRSDRMYDWEHPTLFFEGYRHPQLAPFDKESTGSWVQAGSAQESRAYWVKVKFLGISFRCYWLRGELIQGGLPTYWVNPYAEEWEFTSSTKDWEQRKGRSGRLTNAGRAGVGLIRSDLTYREVFVVRLVPRQLWRARGELVQGIPKIRGCGGIKGDISGVVG